MGKEIVNKVSLNLQSVGAIPGKKAPSEKRKGGGLEKKSMGLSSVGMTKEGNRDLEGDDVKPGERGKNVKCSFVMMGGGEGDSKRRGSMGGLASTGISQRKRALAPSAVLRSRGKRSMRNWALAG